MQTTNDRRGWWTPIIFDPSNSLTMYFGGNRVNRSTNGGVTLDGGQPRPLEERASTGSALRLQDQGRHHDGCRVGIQPRGRVGRHRRRSLVEDDQRHRREPDLDEGRKLRPSGLLDHAHRDRPGGRERRLRHLLGLPGRRRRSSRGEDDRRRNDLVEHLRRPACGPGERHRHRRGEARSQPPMSACSSRTTRGRTGTGWGRRCRSCR